MPPDVVMGAVLLAGAVACAAAAAHAPHREPARLALAAALAFGGAGLLAGGSERDELEIAASALGAFGVVLLVLERSRTVTRLSWLDAAMGATSSAALAVVFDASAATALAVAGAMAGLALSRWRPDPPVLLAAAGVAALGAGSAGALAAAPALGVAAWLRTGRPAEGPEFNPVVLCAILAFATTALALLTFGQFETVDDVAVVLAGLTVLAGMGRAGLTVTERLAESDRRAITDDLTGLSNRRHLVDRLETAVDAAADARDALALLVVDLDGFKELNDTLGHHAGDEVLRQIGPRLRPLLRERDTLARLGGDEFAVILVPGRRGRGEHGRAAPPGGARALLRGGGHPRPRGRERRHRALPPARPGRARAPPARGRGHVRGQADAHRPRGLPARARPPQPPPARADRRAARGAAGRRARRPLPAQGRAADRARCAGWRRSCAGSIRSAGCSGRASSCRLWSRAG